MSIFASMIAAAQLANCTAPDLSQGPAGGSVLEYDLNGFSVAQAIAESRGGVVTYQQLMDMPEGAPQPPRMDYTSAAGLVTTSIESRRGPGAGYDLDPDRIIEEASRLEAGETLRYATSYSNPAQGGGLQRRDATVEVTFMGCGQEETAAGAFDVAIYEIESRTGDDSSVKQVAWAPALGWPVRETSGSATQVFTGREN